MIKRGLILLCLAVFAVVLSVACAPAAGGKTSINVSYDDFTKQNNIVKDVTLPVGGTITVQLTSNRTTGFSWNENAQISDTSVLKQSAYTWVPPADTGGRVGAAGSEVWTFTALKAGRSTVSEEYSQPWEGGTKATWTFKLNVTVQ